MMWIWSEERLFLSWCCLTSPAKLWSFYPVSLTSRSSCLRHFFSAFLNIEVLSSSIYCASIVIPTIITIICSHVGLGGYDGVRQHRGADREGRGEAHPLGWFMVLLTVAICLSACSDSNSSAGPACRTVGGWRGMLIDFYSNLFFVGVTQYPIILRYIHYECMTELLRHTPIVFL